MLSKGWMGAVYYRKNGKKRQEGHDTSCHCWGSQPCPLVTLVSPGLSIIELLFSPL